MGTSDRSGHLGINLRKNAGHCVRCDWGTKDVRAWLKKYGFNGGIYIQSGTTLADLRKRMETQVKPYQLGHLVTPPMRRIASANYRDGDPFASSLLDKKVGLAEARRNHVCYCDDGRYDGYIVFPFIEGDEVVYWQARAAYPHLLADSKLKKRNPTDKEASLGKSYWLYGYDFSQPDGVAVLTEGTLDQISTQTWIEENDKDIDGWYALSLQGTTISAPDPQRHPLNSQLGKLLTLSPREVIVLLDAEAWVKAEALAEILHSYGFNAKAAKLPKGDPNEASKPIMKKTLTSVQSPIAHLKHRLETIPIR